MPAAVVVMEAVAAAVVVVALVVQVVDNVMVLRDVGLKTMIGVGIY